MLTHLPRNKSHKMYGILNVCAVTFHSPSGSLKLKLHYVPIVDVTITRIPLGQDFLDLEPKSTTISFLLHLNCSEKICLPKKYIRNCIHPKYKGILTRPCIMVTWIWYFLATDGYPVGMGQIAEPRGSVVGWGTMLQAGRSRVRYPMMSLDVSIDPILPAALSL
jgi:hypothetical protein